MSSRLAKKQSGFTIIELMIATTVFSLVLMSTLAGIIQITKMYFQGVALTRTQEVARNVVDEIGESIRFTKEPLIVQPELLINGGIGLGASDTGYFCIGARRYTYAIDRQLKEVPNTAKKEKRHVLWVDQPTSCTGPANLTRGLTDGRELLSENMRLTRFGVKDNGASYTIDISVAYGDSDLIVYNDNPVTCESAFAGGEFCGVANLSVSVVRRL